MLSDSENSPGQINILGSLSIGKDEEIFEN